MKNAIRYTLIANLLLALGLISSAAGAQEHEVDRKIDAAIDAHARTRDGGPLAAVLHGKRDPMRQSGRNLAVLVGPFHFGGHASGQADPPRK